MKPLATISPRAPQLDDDQLVPDQLIGRLLDAGESAGLDLLGGFSSEERANLAMFCYHKAHLRRIGLSIAATCDQSTLVQAWGTTLGQAIFTQSRELAQEPKRAPGQHRPKISLAKLSTYDPRAVEAVPLAGDDDVIQAA